MTAYEIRPLIVSVLATLALSIIASSFTLAQASEIVAHAGIPQGIAHTAWVSSNSDVGR